jgi:hypothetical protein
MTHTELIKRAASVINSQKLWDRVVKLKDLLPYDGDCSEA